MPMNDDLMHLGLVDEDEILLDEAALTLMTTCLERSPSGWRPSLAG